MKVSEINIEEYFKKKVKEWKKGQRLLHGYVKKGTGD